MPNQTDFTGSKAHARSAANRLHAIYCVLFAVILALAVIETIVAAH